MNKSIKNKSGFTLIELLVVIFIIAMLASIILAATQSTRTRARDARRKVDLESIKKAIELYRFDNGGNAPPANNGIGACAGGVCTSDVGSPWLAGLAPAFVASVPRDPSNPSTVIRYRYAIGANITDYELDAIFEDASNNGLENNDNGDCDTQPTARYETGTLLTILSPACGP